MKRNSIPLAEFQVGRRSKNSELNKYLSVINILKGFEEYTLDANGIIISSNLEAVNITGYEEWEVIGKEISIFYSTEDQITGKPASDLMRCEKNGTIVFTCVWMKKRSSSFLAKIKLTPIKEHGLLIGYKLLLQDATHKAVSSQKIKKFKDEYLNLFNNSFVGILKFNMSDFTIFMINEKGLKMLNSVESQPRDHFDQIFESQEEFAELIKRLKTEKKVEGFQFKLRKSNAFLMVSLRYFSNEEFAEGILLDVTDLVKKENEIARLNQELDQLIYHASHELRSPLTSMLGLINLMRQDSSCIFPKDYTGLMEQKVNKLDSLLKSIVAIAYNNRVETSKENIEWNGLMNSCLRDGTIFNEKNVAVECEVNQVGVFIGDENRIKIIIKNLLSNAYKYQNPHGINARVKIQVHSDENHASIVIADNGIGIDEKYLRNVFQMFYKAHVHSTEGHGLGLYIVKAMVDRVDGKIYVESKMGEGTQFKVVVPNRQMQFG
ncbi:MAG TPA: PAS domain-containing sensor histidine kinase [Cyclobacteriaceae bacterium]|jgi:PAS domain S-box-containing protein|nr:PAS domain-containing sensor histidine kinase [Cyclobacteriaceae bacterium]